MGGKGGGSAPTVTQPSVTPSPYEERLAGIANNLWSTTKPLRSTFIDSWMDFLNPTQTLRPGAQPISQTPIYGKATSGTPATQQMYQDPNTGQLYSADKVQKNGLQSYVSIGDSSGGSTTTWVIPYGQASGGTPGTGKQITGYTPQYAASDYITQQFNPANLPGYTPMYDISRRGLESQFNTAMQQTIGGTPRGGTMQDALSRLQLGRAESVGQLPGQISSGLIQDAMNKAYGAAFNTPTQSIAGLGAANQGYVSTQNALINAQMQANAINAAQNQGKGGLGMLGSGLGTIVGSAFGAPGVGAIVGRATGSLGGK